MLKRTSKKILHLKFSQQLTIVFTISVILLSTLVSYAVSHTSNDILKKQMRAQGLQITQTFTDQSKLALLYQSEYAAQDAVKAIADFPDIEVIQLKTVDGNVLYNSREFDIENTQAVMHKDMTIKVFEDDDEWIFYAPVYSEAGFDEELADIYQETETSNTLLGYATLSMSKKTLHLLQRRTYEASFIVSFTIAILIIFTLFRISTHHQAR